MLLIVYVAVFLLAIYFLKKFVGKDGKPLPGPPGKFFVGNAFDYTEATMHFKLSEWADRYGPIYAISAFGQRHIVLSSEHLLRKAFSSAEYRDYFSGRQPSFYGTYLFFGNQGISFHNNLKIHSSLRKGFTKCLHKYGEGLKAFEDLITKETQRLVKRFKAFDGKDCEPRDELRCYLANVMSTFLSGDIINETGVADDVMWKYTRGNNEIMNAKMFLISSMFPFLRFFPCKVRDIYHRLLDSKRGLMDRFFSRMKANYEPLKTRGLVDAMLHSQQKDIKTGTEVLFTDEQICSVILESVAAGLVTSVSTLCSIILCVVHDQEIQDKVYKEIMEVIGPDRHPQLSDRPNMPYLEAVIYESLRFSPPGPLSIPHFCTDDVEFEGYKIHKGDQLIMNIWHMQHDEAIWGDPFVYRPERFLDEHGQLLPPSHKLRQNWMPFSIGRRQCIGESLARSRIFLLFATLFQQYRFLPPENGECISSDPRTYELGVALHPKNFKCKIEPRKHA